jgi:hypothetical protein
MVECTVEEDCGVLQETPHVLARSLPPSVRNQDDYKSLWESLRASFIHSSSRPFLTSTTP